MKTPEQITKQLPAELADEVLKIAARTVNTQALLRVCLVGEFSAGKSSLLNALLGESLLPTAREETTALPTFIEYAPNLVFSWMNYSGDSELVSKETFLNMTVNAPDDALYSAVGYPAEWLKNLIVIDLPGLGSKSAKHSDYTHSQISACDVIIYLLSSRGVTQNDVKVLRLIKSYGKHIFIAVSQWDVVETSIAEGEQAPDLNRWRQDIVRETGIDLPLIGVSKFGLGKEEILDFLNSTKQQIQIIRQNRFLAELKPLLDNALDEREAKKEVCSANSVEEVQALQKELLTQKESLLAIKNELYQQTNDDLERVEKNLLEITEKQRNQLATELKNIPVVKSENWQPFIDTANHALQNHIALLAGDFEQHSANYGKLELPTVHLQKLNLHLPPPQVISLEDFVDDSRLNYLQTELEKKQQDAQFTQAKLQNLPEIDVEPIQKQVSALRQERNLIAQQELPTVTKTIEGSNQKAQIGKAIGQLLDIGAIVFEAPLALVKTASMAAEGSRILKTASTVAKTANTIISHPQTPIHFLEKLSFSYWGEQIGKQFDSPEQTIQITDPQAEAEQRQLLQQHAQQIAEKRAELDKLEKLQEERAYTGWALEQNLKEQQVLKNSIQMAQERIANAQKAAQIEHERQQQALLDNHHQQVMTQMLLQFDQHARSMLELLRKTCKNYWHDYVEKALEQHLQRIENLTLQLKEAPQQRQAMLASIENEITQIKSVLNTL